MIGTHRRRRVVSKRKFCGMDVCLCLPLKWVVEVGASRVLAGVGLTEATIRSSTVEKLDSIGPSRPRGVGLLQVYVCSWLMYLLLARLDPRRLHHFAATARPIISSLNAVPAAPLLFWGLKIK